MTQKPTYEELEQRIRVLEATASKSKQAEDSLRQSGKAFQSLFDDHTAIKLIVDPDTGAIISANHAAAAFYGWSRKTLAQMHIQQINILPPGKIKETLQNARDRKRTHFEFQHRLADGSVRDVGVFSSRMITDGHEYLHSIVHDITEQKRAEREKAIILEIGRIIGSSLNLDKVYERFIDEARKLIPFDRIRVSLYDPQSGTLRLAYMNGMAIAGRKPGDPLPLVGSLTEELIKTRTGVIVNATSLKQITKQYPAAVNGYKAGMRSLLTVPLISQGKVIGSLGFRSKTPNAYEEQDLSLAQQIGDHIAGAIANAEVYANLKMAEQEIAVIAEIGRIIGSSLNIDEVYERFLIEVKKLIGFDRLSVALHNSGDSLVRLAHVSKTDITTRLQGEVFPLSGSLNEKVMRARMGLIAKVETLEAVAEHYPDLIYSYKAGVRSAICVPLFSRSEVIGSLNFRSILPNAYTEKDLVLAQQIGDQIAGAVANAEVYANLKRADQEIAVIAEIGRIISASLDIDEVYERFTIEVKKLIGFDRISVALHNRGDGMVRIAHISDIRRRGDVFPLAGSLNEKVTQTRKGLITRLESLEEVVDHYPSIVKSYREGMRSTMSVPLFSQGEVIGILGFRSKTPNAYGERDLAIAQQIGDQIAGAIANAQIYANLKRAEQEMAIIAEIGRIIGSSLNIDEVYERFTIETKKLIGFDRLSVALHNRGDSLVRLAHVSKNDITARLQGDVFPLAGSLNEKLIQTRTGLNVQMESLEEIAEHYPSLVDVYKAGVRSALSVPLFSHGEVIGSLNFRSTRPYAYTPADLHLAERIGEQIAGAIANATLYGELSKTEKALRESNALFSHFMRHSPIYAFIKEVTPTRSIVLRASENYQQMIGIPGHEMIGKTMEELFPAAFAAKITADDWAVVSAGKVLTSEEELNGRSYSTIKFPIVNKDKSLLAGYTIDITERRQAYDALQKSEAKFRAIVENTHDGILFMDAEAKVLYRSPSYRQINGYSDEDWVGHDLFAIVHPDDLAVIRRIWAEMLAQPESLYGLSYRIRHKDQTWKTVESTVQNLLNNPNMRAVFMTTRDVTDRKRVEEQLVQAQKMEAVGRLAGGVAHDFNNMLGVILGHTELALEQADATHPLHVRLQEIKKATERSANLTHQLLAYARKQTIAPRVLDLNENVAGVLKMLQRIIGEDIDLTWQPGADLWPVKMDPSQIDQILANLCVNARDAISGIGKMTIETAKAVLNEGYCAIHPGFIPGEYVRITVSDDGCGMDRETLSHLFEPFFTTKGIGKGTGLGLATVYGVVKQNNGFINVYSEPGLGTTFTIYLPRYAGKAEQEQPQGAQVLPLRGQETILVVEDEPGLLDLTATLLNNQGYTVLAASTPGEAIRLASEHSGGVHLLITDVVMPEMNGRELAKNLLALYPDLKRLFMSGYTANVIAHHGVLDEGVHFIQKPFFIKDLANKVREVLDEQ